MYETESSTECVSKGAKLHPNQFLSRHIIKSTHSTRSKLPTSFYYIYFHSRVDKFFYYFQTLSYNTNLIEIHFIQVRQTFLWHHHLYRKVVYIFFYRRFIKSISLLYLLLLFFSYLRWIFQTRWALKVKILQ